MTHTSFSMLSKSLAFAALFAFAPAALAQEQQPPQEQLAMPGAESTTVAPVATIETPQTASASGNASADPCPAPEGAASKGPDDLAKVQEEIDRFTLCVQRAQLLERLNESSLKNQQAEDSSLGLSAPGGMAPGMANAQMTPGMNMPGLAPLPAAALAGADVEPLSQAAGTSMATDAGVAVEPVKEEPKNWTIKEIYGNGNDMQARLISPEGDEVKARGGMKLPEGPTIVRISPSGVTVRDGGNTKSLEWAKS